MYLCGFSLNNLSLMALTIATGFVVDSAIVVLENIARHCGSGNETVASRTARYSRSRFYGAVDESVTGGGVPAAAVDGRIARADCYAAKIAVTLSVAIGISLLVSLTLTPMMCGWMLKASKPREQKRLRGFGRMWVAPATRLRQVTEMGAQSYPSGGRGAAWHRCAEYLAVCRSRRRLPGAGHWRVDGQDQADQSISFQAMRGKLQDFMKIILTIRQWIMSPALQAVRE